MNPSASLRSRTMRAVGLAAVAVFCYSPCPSARADARLDYALEFGMLYDNNVHLTESAPEGDEMLIPRLLFTFTDDSSRLQANVAGDLSYYHYLRGTFNDDFRGVLAGTALWHILPERFDWVFEDYLGRQPINVLLDNTPDNQQQTNFFVTGPTLKFRLGERLAGQLDLRYSNTYAERTTDFNGNRLSALAAVIYELGATTSLSANVQGQRVGYDNAAQTLGNTVQPSDNTGQTLNYDREDVYAGYTLKGAHSGFELNVGYTWLDFSHGGGSDSGPLLRGNFHIDASARSTFSVRVLRGFSDAAQDLITDTNQIGYIDVGSGLDNMLISPEPYTETRVDFAYDYHVERFHFSIAPYVRKLVYVNSFDFDNSYNDTARGGYGQFAYQVTQLMNLSVIAGMERRKYSTIDRTDTDRDLGLQMSYEMTRHWQWRVQLQELVRSTTAAGLGYTDHQLLFALRYTR
jgi:hypothetical protein